MHDDHAQHELPPAPPLPAVLSLDDAVCVTCSYRLAGLDAAGLCPECGTPVARSLMGNHLRFASPQYLRWLHTGLLMIIISFAGQLAIMALSLVVGLGMVIASGMGGVGTPAMMVFTFVSALLGTLVSLLGLYGWWLFSSPDPGFVGRDDGGQARRLVRVSVVLLAVMSVAQVFTATPAAAARPLVMIASMGMGVIGLAITALWFFAAILYIRWLAPRASNTAVALRTRLYIWLLPVLTTVGALLCGLGPLIALILFWIMLDALRRDLKHIRVEADRLAALSDPAVEA